MKFSAAAFALTATTLFYGAPLVAADDGFSTDLKAKIALQGKSCDEIVNSKRNGDSATCKDGNQYRVSVNAQGRLEVQKL